jgi:hypothetical protein
MEGARVVVIPAAMVATVTVEEAEGITTGRLHLDATRRPIEGTVGMRRQ